MSMYWLTHVSGSARFRGIMMCLADWGLWELRLRIQRRAINHSSVSTAKWYQLDVTVYKLPEKLHLRAMNQITFHFLHMLLQVQQNVVLFFFFFLPSLQTHRITVTWELTAGLGHTPLNIYCLDLQIRTHHIAVHDLPLSHLSLCFCPSGAQMYTSNTPCSLHTVTTTWGPPLSQVCVSAGGISANQRAGSMTSRLLQRPPHRFLFLLSFISQQAFLLHLRYVFFFFFAHKKSPEYKRTLLFFVSL